MLSRVRVPRFCNSLMTMRRALEKTAGVPGLNLPGLDITATAASYGVSAHQACSTDDVAKLVREGIADRANPTLINVPVTKVHMP